jgi:uncharacterized protein YkwD
MTARGPRGSSLVISVLVTVLAVAGTMVLVIRLPGRATEMTSASGASRGPAPAMAAARLARGVTAAPSRRGAPSSKAPATTAAPTASAPATATPGGTAPGSTAPGSTAPASTAPVAGESTATEQVLALINQARAQAGLPAYTISSGLDTSAARHTAVMAGGCGLSHQCPGEPDLGARETAAGVAWTAAGENIGEGGPVADTPAAIAQMAAGLTQSMLAEKPPDDGHRLNILSSAFTHAGISVFRDSSGTVWMTQDFSN